MISLIINDDKRIDILKKEDNKIEKKKYRTKLFIGGMIAIYVIAKLSVNYEREIIELKKVIEEMKSKGE